MAIHPSRIIGLDVHPDTFTAALLSGPTPAAALTEKVFNRIPLAQLPGWAQKHTTPEDLCVLEASGNSFHLARTLHQLGRPALVLESAHLGKLKEAHANNDQLSAVRIGKAYLAGTAREVWVPDARTQERRDWFHAHRKAVKLATQTRNRLGSYLSDQGVRLPKGQFTEARLRQVKVWSPRQWLVIQTLLLEMRHADEQRAQWQSLLAQEVLQDAQLLSLVRLCGVREVIAFALLAVIGDIHRFASPKKLVKYVGLDPAFDHSGNGHWSGGIGGHGRRDLRGLLIEAAHALLRSGHPLARWGKKLLRRKGEVKLVVAAIARKLTVAVWHLLMGRWTAVEEIEPRLALKVGKIISHLGARGLKELGQTRKALRLQVYDALKAGRSYELVNPQICPTKETKKKTTFNKKLA